MNNSLIRIIDPRDRETKKQLRLAIGRRKSILSRRMAQLSSLQSELDMIKNEYNVRIGKLNLKDNELDLQLIRLNNILDLLAEGMTPEQALAATEDTYYTEEAESIKAQRARIEQEEQFLIHEEEVRLDVNETEFRALWRSLLFKFHPDLATDETEKYERAEIMKKINSAYDAGDMQSLRDIEHMHLNTSSRSATIVDLENQLAAIENKIIVVDQEFIALKISEWHAWYLQMKSKKRDRPDPFRSLEKRLLDDIVRKVEIVTKLREALWSKHVYTI